MISLSDKILNPLSRLGYVVNGPLKVILVCSLPISSDLINSKKWTKNLLLQWTIKLSYMPYFPNSGKM